MMTVPQTVGRSKTMSIGQCTSTEQNDVTSRRRGTRKYVIIGVTCAVIVGLLITGVLVAIKLLTNYKLDSLKIKDEFKVGNFAINETYFKDDSSSWVLQYHISVTGVIDNWVLDDLMKGLRIIKSQLPTGAYQCYLLQYKPIVNSSFTPSESSPQINAVDVNVTKVWYRVSERPINDILSFTSHTAQQFCDSAKVFILFPSSTGPAQTNFTDTQPGSRQKRGWQCDYMDWSNCGYFPFRDKPGVMYYGCIFPCSTI